MDASRVAAIREEMERAAARRLQPHFIRTFFVEAFQRLGGRIIRREEGRFEITHVPRPIRDRDRLIGSAGPVLERYERVTFEREHVSGPPVAAFLCPGHPLLDAVIDLVLERHRELLKRGAVLVDDSDDGEDVRALFYLEHAVQDGRAGREGQQQVVSQRLQFVEVRADGRARDAGPAPYLDYRPIADEEQARVAEALQAAWLGADIEQRVLAYAVERIVPGHVAEVRERRLPEIDKVEHEVTKRLRTEIIYWDHRAQELKAQEAAGKQTRLSSVNAQARANDLAERLQRRLEELNREREISALPPAIRGGAIVVPIGLLRRRAEPAAPARELAETTAEGRDAVERLAMEAVMAAERALGREPRDVSEQKLGYDIESRDAKAGLRFIEVKGRAEGANTVTVSRNEILTALNKPDAFILALVEVANGFAGEPRYVRRPFHKEPDFGATSVTYRLVELLASAGPPS
jgi:hypothetical protein